jgi:hypothetical protein
MVLWRADDSSPERYDNGLSVVVGALPGPSLEGMPVLYIPRHAQGKRTHPDCQRGIVTGKTATHVLVRYGTDRHSNATVPAFLLPDAPGHSQVIAKNCTSVQQSKDYRRFWSLTSLSILAIPNPLSFPQGEGV